MPTLEGSCHCGAVTFTVQSHAAYPFMLCYCSICRKTAGGGGYAINLMGDAETLRVEGREHVKRYHARVEREDGRVEESRAGRHFCGQCASALWVSDPRWPALVHPFASAIDSPLPWPPERVHMMLDFKASWVEVPKGERETHFTGYPEESIEHWHRRRGLWEE